MAGSGSEKPHYVLLCLEEQASRCNPSTRAREQSIKLLEMAPLHSQNKDVFSRINCLPLRALSPGFPQMQPMLVARLAGGGGRDVRETGGGTVRAWERGARGASCWDEGTGPMGSGSGALRSQPPWLGGRGRSGSAVVCTMPRVSGGMRFSWGALRGCAEL